MHVSDVGEGQDAFRQNPLTIQFCSLLSVIVSVVVCEMSGNIINNRPEHCYRPDWCYWRRSTKDPPHSCCCPAVKSVVHSTARWCTWQILRAPQCVNFSSPLLRSHIDASPLTYSAASYTTCSTVCTGLEAVICKFKLMFEVFDKKRPMTWQTLHFLIEMFLWSLQNIRNCWPWESPAQEFKCVWTSGLCTILTFFFAKAPEMQK